MGAYDSVFGEYADAYRDHDGSFFQIAQDAVDVLAGKHPTGLQGTDPDAAGQIGVIAALMHLAVVVNNVGEKIDRLAAAPTSPEPYDEGFDGDDGVHGGIPRPAPSGAFTHP